MAGKRAAIACPASADQQRTSKPATAPILPTRGFEHGEI